jgi:PAS domain S-box-containing protein
MKEIYPNEDTFRKVFENHEAIMLLIDPGSGKILDANKAAEKFYGFHAGSLKKMNLSEINTSPQDYIEKVLDEALKRNRNYFVFQHKLADQSLRKVEVHSSPISLKGEEILFAIIHDISERIKVEEALLESEERYRSLAETNQDIIVVYDMSGTIKYMNRMGLDFFGYSETDYVGRNILVNVKQEDLKKLKERMGERGSGYSQPRLIEIELKNPNGDWVAFEVNTSSIILDGKTTSIISICRNIAEKKQTEKLQEIQFNIANAVVNAKNLNELFEIVRNELSALIDTTNFLIAFYNELTQMLSSPFERDERDHIPEWPVKKSLTGLVVKHMQSFLLSKEEILQLAATGTIDLVGSMPEEWLGVPLRIGNKILGAIVVQNYQGARTYTSRSIEILEMIANQLSTYIERKKSEENALKLSKAVIQSPIAIMMTDIEGNIQFVNPKFIEVTGYTFDEVLGANPRFLKSNENDPELYSDLWKTILSGNNWQGELKNRKKNGELFWENITIAPLVNDSGQITQFIALEEDITDKKKMVEELITAKNKAEESDKLKSAFLANISHEIRTPMNAIIGFSDFLTNPELEKERLYHYTSIIQQQAYNLLSIIEDILDISKIEAGQMKSLEQIGDVEDILKGINETFESDWKGKSKKNVKLITENLLTTEENKIKTDIRWLRQILTNLVGNAFKFTYDGSIKMSCRRFDYDLLLFSVSDTGMGIDKSKFDLIFERFRQGDDTNIRDFGGTGLGLAISKGLIEILGGSIWVESEQGKGSTFFFTIPYKSAITLQNTESPKRVNSYNWSHKHLLLIEDNEFNAEYLKIALASSRIKVTHVANGEEAIKQISRISDFDIVLLDIRLPDISGYELAKQIKAARPDIPVIAQTAFASVEYKEKCLKAGCDDHISKPIKSPILLAVLDRYL